jgi:hypothetical protein
MRLLQSALSFSQLAAPCRELFPLGGSFFDSLFKWFNKALSMAWNRYTCHADQVDPCHI